MSSDPFDKLRRELNKAWSPENMAKSREERKDPERRGGRKERREKWKRQNEEWRKAREEVKKAGGLTSLERVSTERASLEMASPAKPSPPKKTSSPTHPPPPAPSYTSLISPPPSTSPRVPSTRWLFGGSEESRVMRGVNGAIPGRPETPTTAPGWSRPLLALQ